MLEYPLEEARDLLTNNLKTAKENLQQVETDLDFLKDQITTTEVNIARVYNWDVRKRAQKGPNSGEENLPGLAGDDK